MDLDANQLRTIASRDNPAAVTQLIESFYERIYAFLRRLTGSDADAADLTQTDSNERAHLPSFIFRFRLLVCAREFSRDRRRRLHWLACMRAIASFRPFRLGLRRSESFLRSAN